VRLIVAASALNAVACGPAGLLSISVGPKPREMPEFVQEIPADVDIRPEPDVATLVFVRSTSDLSGFWPAIVDENGAFLGVSLASSLFTATVRPGHHIFAACGADGAALRAYLEPGRRYAIEVIATGTVFSKDLDLIPIRPATEVWTKGAEWRSLKRIVADERRGQEDLGDEAGECVQKARAKLSGYDASSLARHTIGPLDDW
jgi:hypothetical protein